KVREYHFDSSAVQRRYVIKNGLKKAKNETNQPNTAEPGHEAEAAGAISAIHGAAVCCWFAGDSRSTLLGSSFSSFHS
ncbi:hypothetical protein CEXT_380931, partial [Caerostris extrusa]